MVDRQYPPEWEMAAEQYRGIFCRKMQKMSDLLTFNTGAAEIYANVKKNAEH